MKRMWVSVVVVGLLLSWSVVPAEDFYVVPVNKQVTSWDKTISGAARWTLVLNNEAVLDRETGLVWERNTDSIKKTWLGAFYYCYDLSLGNRMGWRVPTMEELTSLIDTSQDNPTLPTGHPFTNVQSSQSSYYWTSSTDVTVPELAWGVGFYNDSIGRSNKLLEHYVRCVRAGS
ncbi:MAG: DUF1566 domain-containing protein [Desulforhabdus sp.]|nr:DUF1566 domain-containing protein [Desulforhabdus sp.]